MTAAWKNAIRAKRRAFNKYLNERTQQNWQEKVKNRNEAVRQRRIAERQYWKKKTADLMDVRAHCYCASLLHTQIHTPRHPSSARPKQKNKQ